MTICAIIFAALPVFDFATNSIAERVAGADPAVCLSRLVDYPPSKGRLGFPRCLWEKPFAANDKFWLKDVDFSCVSPWNDSYGALRAGTAISKRHVIFAKHFPLWKGVRIVFVGADGEICPVRVDGTKAIDGTDIMVGALDYELTPNIRPAKILPEDYERYIGNGKGLPVVTFNQGEKAFLADLTALPTNGEGRCFGSCVIAKGESRSRLSGRIVGGDSGNPAFLQIGNEAVLLYCLKIGGCGGGPSLHLFRKEIQKAMDELCPGYKLETFDFKKLKETIDDKHDSR